MQFCDVLGVKTVVSDISHAVRVVERHYDKLSGKYITFLNIHSAVMANEDKVYKEAQSNAALTFADGWPIATCQHIKGYKKAKRVAGPDFMEAIFRCSVSKGYSHFFYGCNDTTLMKLKENLQKRYPGIRIVGMYAPPMMENMDKDFSEDIQRINSTGADFIWIGLGAPKQELWMYKNKGKVCGVMLGVGAGFDFGAHTVQRAPGWMRELRMEWLYRLCREPKRLFGRYMIAGYKFVKMWCKQ